MPSTRAGGEGYLLGSRAAVAVSYEGRSLREVEIADDVAPVRFSLATVRGVRPTRRARVFAEHATRLLTTQGRTESLRRPRAARPARGPSPR